MNRNFLSATLLGGFSAVALTSAASAADLPRKTAPQPAFVQAAPLFTWTGFYVGLSGGYTFENGKSQLTGSPALLATGLAPAGSAKTLGDGFLIGGTVGYNYQIGNFVAGLEGDLSYIDVGKRFSFTSGGLTTSLSQEMTYFGTVRGRLGVAFDRLLVYGTGGLAFADAKSDTAISGFGAQWAGKKDDVKLGYTLGAGVEYAFTNNWSVKAEYLYYDLGKQNYASPQFAGPAFPGVFGTTKAEYKGNIVRAGLNYRF